MQWRDALGDDAFEVCLGESGEGGEVPVEEREAVVIVLQIETLPHTRGELIDETELTVVVTGPDLIEQGRLDLGPQRGTRRLADLELQFDTTTGDIERQVRLIA